MNRSKWEFKMSPKVYQFDSKILFEIMLKGSELYIGKDYAKIPRSSKRRQNS